MYTHKKWLLIELNLISMMKNKREMTANNQATKKNLMKKIFRVYPAPRTTSKISVCIWNKTSFPKNVITNGKTTEEKQEFAIIFSDKQLGLFFYISPFTENTR